MAKDHKFTVSAVLTFSGAQPKPKKKEVEQYIKEACSEYAQSFPTDFKKVTVRSVDID